MEICDDTIHRFKRITRLNKNISFFKRYINTKRLIRNNKMKTRIKEIKYPNKKFTYFLIKHNLILTYKTINKINSII